METTVDPRLKREYEKTHSVGLYGTSSINFLPDVVLNFVDKVAQKKIDLTGSVRVLDYGCGHSVLLDVFAEMIDRHRDDIFLGLIDGSVGDVMKKLEPSLKQAVTGYSREKYAEMAARESTFVRKHRYDPAIPEYAKKPGGKFDFVICTDVLEHIPETAVVDEREEHLLSNLIREIYEYSDNTFFNISNRRAQQILGNGENAHCTVHSPAWWERRMKEINPEATQVFSRDLTGTHFVTPPPSSEAFKYAYTLFAEYGEVDLIPWPPKKATPEAKRKSLMSILDHKDEVRRENLRHWRINVDPEARGISALSEIFNQKKPVDWDEIAEKRDFILDVDKTMYKVLGFSEKIDERMCEAANADPILRRIMVASIGEDRNIQMKDLAGRFRLMVGECDKQGTEKLKGLFDKVYKEDDYKLIPSDPRLVEAILQLEKSGKRILFYSNSAASHVQNVLRRVGFDEAFIDRTRENTYDVVDSAREGVSKPSEEGLDNFLKDKSVNPLKAVFVDDSFKNLQPAIAKGILCIWPRTSHTLPGDKDAMAAKNLGFVTVFDTRHAIINIAKHVLCPSVNGQKVSLPGVRR